MVVSDITDVFVPLVDGFLVNVKQAKVIVDRYMPCNSPFSTAFAFLNVASTWFVLLLRFLTDSLDLIHVLGALKNSLNLCILEKLP